MADNKVKEAVSCPIRGFNPPEFPASNVYNNENQNNSLDKDDKKEAGGNNGFAGKESSSFSLPNLSLMLPKRFDENQDSQEELSNPDLHNGHNNPDAIDIKHRNRSLGELLEESQDLPDTVLMDCSKDYSSTRGGEQKANSSDSDRENEKREGNSETAQEREENSGEEKAPEDSASQDIFEDNEEKGEPKDQTTAVDKNEASNNSNNQDSQFSEGFDLHLSETQSFLPSGAKENENAVTVSESDDSNAMEEESNEKVADSNDEKVSDDVDMSNESSGNTVSNLEQTVLKDESSDVANRELSTEDISNGSDEVCKKKTEENKSEIEGANKEEEVMDVSEAEGDNPSLTKSDENTSGVEATRDDTNPKKDDGCSKNNEMSNKEEETSKDGKNVREKEGEEKEGPDKEENMEEAKGDDKKELDKVDDGEIKMEKGSDDSGGIASRPQRKRQPKKEEKELVNESNRPQPMETEETSSDVGKGDGGPCPCQPSCHSRIESVSQHLNNACSQLKDFIKLKRREENKVLQKYLDMLTEIQNISKNEQVTGETKIGEHVLIPEETPPKRKSGIKRKSSDAETPTPRKKSNTEDKASKKSEKKSNVEFKDLKGLAVFAKWPNSGWYYPGKVEELTGSDWKEASNVTVKFYDGLVREMKNINILPAYLIPPGSMLSDLDDETEMVVLSSDGSNQNSVDFKLASKDNSGREIEMNFNRLAIRANHMKTIKQQLEPTTDVLPKKMHMVSLDNLVSGRRSRGRSKKDSESAEEKTPTNQTERRSTSSSSSTPSKKSATPKRARN